MRSGDIPILLPLTHARSFGSRFLGLCVEGGWIPSVKPKSGARESTVKPWAPQQCPRHLPRDHSCCESTCCSRILSQGCGLKGGKLWDALVERGSVCHVLGSLLWCLCVVFATLSLAELELVCVREKNSKNNNQKRFKADVVLPRSPRFPQVFSDISVQSVLVTVTENVGKVRQGI